MIVEARRAIGDEGRLLAEVVLSTLVAPEDDLLPAMTTVVVGVASELAACPPLGVVLDLAYVLVAPVVRPDEARRRLQEDLPAHGELARAVATAFDAFLAPIMAAQAVVDLRDALRRHPEEARLRGAAIVVSEILGRQVSGKKTGKALDVGSLRRVLLRPAAEMRTRGASQLLSSRVCADLAQRYEAFAKSSRLGGQLVTRGDLLVAENAPVLVQRAARVALTHIADAAEAIAQRVPKNLAHRRSRGEDVTSRQRDESAYPMGGFSSMSNVGNIESVVSSELAYASTGPDISEDLFTVRWALGELLYYTRDESVATRRRTTLSVVLDGSLVDSRVKDRHAPFQRVVLALAAVTVLVERALWLLREEAVRFVVFFDPALEDERRLLELALVRVLQAGQLETRAAAGEEVLAFEATEAERVRLLPIRVASAQAAVADPAAKRRPFEVLVADVPSLRGGGRDATPVAAPAAPGGPGRKTAALDAWAQIVRALLQSL